MFSTTLALTHVERVALEAIREHRPEVLAGFSEWITEVLDTLASSSQGRIVTDADVDNLLLTLRDKLVGRMLVEMEPWGEDEDLRAPVVELLSRHLLANARSGFIRRVVKVKQN